MTKILKITIFISLVIALLISLVSVHFLNSDIEGVSVEPIDSINSKQEELFIPTANQDTDTNEFLDNNQHIKTATPNENQVASNTNGLPISIELMGIFFTGIESTTLVDLKTSKGRVVLKETDEIFDSAVFIKFVQRNRVTLEYEGLEYALALGDGNSFLKRQQHYDYMQMTPDEIGSHPKIIEHVLRLSDNPFGEEGKLISAGLNAKLFRAARLQEGDILLSINDLNINNEDEFEALQESIPISRTLEFKVNRNGRIITLYLDIPNKTLSF